jgi:hypothetical protein
MGQDGSVRCFFRGDPAPTHDSVEQILNRAYGPLPGTHEIAFEYYNGKGYKVLSASSQVCRQGTNPSLEKFEVRLGADIRQDVIALLRRNELPVEE